MTKSYHSIILILLTVIFSNYAFALDEIESGNTTGTAQSISLATPLQIKGQLSPDADVDYYSFTGQAGNKFSAAIMTNASTSISTDTEFRLLRSDGTTVVEADDDNGVLSSLSSSLSNVNLPVTGTYYLEVKDKSPTVQIRPYYLYLVLQTASATAENGSIDPNTVPSSKFVVGNLSSAADTDFYSMTVNAGDTIFASLDLDPDRNGTNFEGRLIFIHPGATVTIPAFDDSGEGDSSPDSEAGFITVKNSGTLRVGLGSTGATFGNYQMQVAVFSQEDQSNCQTYTATGGNTNLSIPANTEVINSVLNVPSSSRIANIAVSVNLIHANMPDLDLSLISPSGNEVVLFTDIGSSSETTMNLILKDSATIPVGSFPSLVDNLIFQPEGGENSGRLAWFNGMEQSGNWTLRIRDDQTAAGGTLNSWSLIICESEPVNDCGENKVEAEIFSKDFEVNNGSFTHSGTNDEWEYGLPSYAPIASCYSGSNCWKTDLNNTYNVSSSQVLTSPTIDLSAYLPPFTVNWAHKYNLEDAKFDQYAVAVEDDSNPANSLTLFEHFDGDMFSDVGNPITTVDQSAGWGLISKDISSLSASNINLNFQLVSDSSVNYTGVAIDDVAVYGCLSDQDNDGTADINDGCPSDGGKSAPGVCGCGVLDADSDSDGTFDCVETCDSDPVKTAPGICGCGTADTDTDSDGTANCLETCDNDPAKVAPGICGCGVADTDSDFDGTANCIETCDNDPAKLAPGACGCGIADTDSDSDGTANCNETCDSDPAKIAPGACGCGIADTDSDSDGTANCNETCDSDPAKLAPGICGCGTADTDSDSDGTANCNETCDSDPAKIAPGACGCGIADTDSDSDGTANCLETCDSDPLKVAPGACGCSVLDTDSDSDGTADCNEICDNDPLKVTAGACGCGNLDTDSDSDGTADCNETCDNDPAKVAPGICGCGVADTDSDFDSTPNCNETCDNDPLKLIPGVCGCGTADTDSDSDSTLDCNETCDSDPTKTLPGICGCGTPESSTDSDSDGTPNCIDQCSSDPLKNSVGSCGCGVAETDSDNDGTPDCVDQCSADAQKTIAGICGCGIADTDSDADGVVNCNDQCELDASKTTVGICGCGVADTDSNVNGITDCLVNPELKAQLLKLSKAVRKLKTTISSPKKLKKIKKAVKLELTATVNYANLNVSQLTLVEGANLIKLVKGVNRKVKKASKLLPTFTVDKKQAGKAIKILSKNIL